jgi:excisionase family DNA binding protein
VAATLPTLEEIRAAFREELDLALAPIRKRQAEELLSMAEAARRLHVSSRTMQRWVKTGAVASVAVGRTRRVPASALETDRPSTLRPAG